MKEEKIKWEKFINLWTKVNGCCEDSTDSSTSAPTSIKDYPDPGKTKSSFPEGPRQPAARLLATSAPDTLCVRTLGLDCPQLRGRTHGLSDGRPERAFQTRASCSICACPSLLLRPRGLEGCAGARRARGGQATSATTLASKPSWPQCAVTRNTSLGHDPGCARRRVWWTNHGTVLNTQVTGTSHGVNALS